MNPQEQQYLDLLTKLLDAPFKSDRTGTGTHSIFGHQMRFDLTQGFPLLTTKKVHFKSIVVELLWFLRGDTNIRYLLQHGCTIWTEWRYKAYDTWAREPHITREYRPIFTQKEFEQKIIEDDSFAAQWGDIGKGYGHQWRNFGEHDAPITVMSPTGVKVQIADYYKAGFDQISWVINEIKTNPNSRRLIVSGWNPHEVNQVDLPPCHTLFQFYVEPMTLNERKRWVDKNYVGGGMQAITDHAKTYPNMYPIASSDEDYREHHINVCDFAKSPKAKLSCQLYQRSCDTFLGLPFNIASYALLTHLIAQECGLGVGEFIWSGGDVHLYSNHVDQAKEQLTREPYPFPKLGLDLKGKSIFDIEPSDISIIDYVSHPAIKAEVAV